MNKEKESKALLEVRKWKEAVAKEAKKLRGRTLTDYFNRGIKAGIVKKAA